MFGKVKLVLELVSDQITHFFPFSNQELTKHHLHAFKRAVTGTPKADHEGCRLQTVKTDYFFFLSCFCIYFWLTNFLVLITTWCSIIYRSVQLLCIGRARLASQARDMTVDVVCTVCSLRPVWSAFWGER